MTILDRAIKISGVKKRKVKQSRGKRMDLDTVDIADDDPERYDPIRERALDRLEKMRSRDKRLVPCAECGKKIQVREAIFADSKQGEVPVCEDCYCRYGFMGSSKPTKYF